MSETITTNKASLAFYLFNDMQQCNLEYTYRGVFNSSITDNILSLAETNLDESVDKVRVKKRVYFIMVEGLQNITRHQDENTIPIKEKPGLFVVQRKKSGYFITSGNLVHGDNVERLKAQIEMINTLGQEELKEYSREILRSGGFSEKGGAGLGLIEIARKSGRKLLFDFQPTTDNFFYFYFHIEIPFDVNAPEDPENYTDNSLQKIKDLHVILDKHNILLNFTGIFNQENMLNLLTIIEGQKYGLRIMKSKLYHIMVELIQNILKHGDDYSFNNVSGHYGTFYISEHENYFILTAGNYILNSRVNDLKELIDKVNTLSKEELDKFFMQVLTDFNINDNQSSGLGIIDMRIKSRQSLDYVFNKVDEVFSFFSLQITVDKYNKHIQPLKLDSTNDSPMVLLDSEAGVFVFEKKSIMQNAYDFYAPIIQWFESYSKFPGSLTIIEIKLSFINTSSLKQYALLFKIFEKLNKKNKVIVRWHYNPADPDLLQLIIRFSRMMKFEIQMVQDKTMLY